MKQRAQDIQGPLLEFPHEEGAVRIGDKRTEHSRLLFDVEVKLRAFVIPVVYKDGGPLRVALRQKGLSACKRTHHMHGTTSAWLTDAAAFQPKVRDMRTGSVLACATTCTV